MAKRVSVDRWLFGSTALLVFLGLVMVFSASAVLDQATHHNSYYSLLRQCFMASLGMAVMWLTMQIDYRRYKHTAVIYPVVGVTALLLIVVLFFPAVNNAHRWIRLAGFSLQPSELAKPALILYLAWFLSQLKEEVNEWRILLRATVPTLFLVALMLKEPDLGTALVCLGVTTCILFVAGLRMRYLGYAALAAVPFFYLFVVRVAWRWARVIAFLHPERDPRGAGFHVLQSLIAVGTGGLTGAGYMEGKQKLFYLPEASSDFIFAVTAEELGLIGTIIIVALFVVFLWRGVRAAWLTEDLFGRYLATGLTMMVILQACINMSVVLGLMPTKGIPLPFLSYGGTSLFVMLGCVGVLLNITRQLD